MSFVEVIFVHPVVGSVELSFICHATTPLKASCSLILNVSPYSMLSAVIVGFAVSYFILNASDVSDIFPASSITLK